MLNCKGIQWRSGSVKTRGYLDLFDFKAFNRKQRFSLTAGLTCAGNEPKSAEVLSMLKSMAHHTGVPFHEGVIVKVADENRDKGAHAKSILIGQICFDEAVECAADMLKKLSSSSWAKSALSRSQAVNLRMASWGDGNSRKIDFAPIAKRVIKSDFPELAFDASGGDQVRFKKHLTDEVEVILFFEKSLPRLGKAFTLHIGIQPTDNSMTGVHFETRLFCLERTREERSWIYSTREEAVASVRISIDALKSMLPSFESTLKLYFDPWPIEFPKQIQRHGNIGARKAMELALPFIQLQLPDAQLIRLGNMTRSLAVRDAEGPELSMDGRLGNNGIWWLHFYSPSQDKSVEVRVPAIGRMRILDHGDQYKDINARRILVPISGDWIDSVDAFRIAEANGGKERRESGQMFGISTSLNSWKSNSCRWELTYLITDKRGRNDLAIAIDATSGGLMSTHI